MNLGLKGLDEQYSMRIESKENLSLMGALSYDDRKALSYIIFDSLDDAEVDIFLEETRKASHLINEKVKVYRNEKNKTTQA